MKFQNPLHVGAPNIGKASSFHSYVDEMFNRRWLTNRGPIVKEFEQKIEEYLGVEHCIAMCNGTVALEIAARAMGLKGEVIVPSMTFIATPHSLLWQQIVPVFCDIDPDTYNIDPEKIEQHINEKTSAILATHVYGRPCDIAKLEAIAKKHELKLYFDAAHAFGCSYQNKMIGNFGECEVFSFHGTKFFNTFEGGAITTNNADLAKKVRLMQNFGFEGLDNVVHIGTNGKMNEVCAAMGLTNFDSLAEFISANQSNYDCYKSCLESLECVKLIEFNKSEKCNYQYIVIELDDDFRQKRDRLIEHLWDHNVLARRYFWPGCHQMEPYKSQQKNTHKHLNKTEDKLDRIVVLPTGTAVSESEITTICNLISDFLR